jgi:hypothetical protein
MRLLAERAERALGKAEAASALAPIQEDSESEDDPAAVTG